MENIKLLEKHFIKGMNNKDFEAFQKSHPTLLQVILDAMDEVKVNRVEFTNGSKIELPSSNQSGAQGLSIDLLQ